MDENEELELALARLRYGKASAEDQILCCAYIDEIKPNKPRKSEKKGDLTKKFKVSILVETYLDKKWQDEVFNDEPELKRREDESVTAYCHRLVYPSVAEIYNMQESTVERYHSEYKQYFKDNPIYPKEHFIKQGQDDFFNIYWSMQRTVKSLDLTMDDIKAAEKIREKLNIKN